MDGNDVSLYAHPKGSDLDLAAIAQYDSYTSKPPKYNGAVGKDQFTWLRRELEEAREAKQRVVLFCHFPIFPKNSHNLWNDSEITKLLAEYSQIIAWINGHNHAGN